MTVAETSIGGAGPVLLALAARWERSAQGQSTLVVKAYHECATQLRGLVAEMPEFQEDITERYYTVQEVADTFSRTPYTVREWLKQGRLEGVKAGDSQWRIPQSSIVKFTQDYFHGGNA